MIANKIIFTTQNGRGHICHNTGIRETVEILKRNISLDEAIVIAVRTASNDTNIKPETVLINKAPTSDNIYLLQTTDAFYFVKHLSSNTFDVIMDNDYGFKFSPNCKTKVYAKDHLIIFWHVDAVNNSRVSHYYLIAI